MRPIRRFTRDPEARARAAQAHASIEGTGDAFLIAADAWEEAGALKQAQRLRARSNELYVDTAAADLARRLEHTACEVDDCVTAAVEPYYAYTERNPDQRGKTVILAIPNANLERKYMIRGVTFAAKIIKLPGPLWSGGSEIVTWPSTDTRTFRVAVPDGVTPRAEEILQGIEARYRSLLIWRPGHPLRDRKRRR